MINQINEHFAIIDPTTKPSQLPRRNKLRRKLFIHKEHKCEQCGSLDNLEAHHIKPVKYFKSPSGFPYQDIYGDHSLQNGMLLCRKCHKKIHKS